MSWLLRITAPAVRRVIPLACVTAGWVGLLSRPAVAQQVPPAHRRDSAEAVARPVARPVTAVEVERKLWLFSRGVMRPVTSDGRLAQGDTARDVMHTLSDAWIAQIASGSVRGLQVDASGVIRVARGEDAAAKAQFDLRLAKPGLSVEEKAYTLLLAVRAYSARPTPDAIPYALHYMARLDSLPASAAEAQGDAHAAIAYAAYDRGDAAMAIAHYEASFQRIPLIPFPRRAFFLGADRFVNYAVSIAGRPGARATIDSMGKVILKLLEAPPELVARDSAWLQMSARDIENFHYVLTQTKFMGAPAPPVIATHWLNTKASVVAVSDTIGVPQARQIPLGDGTIRLLEFGEFSCGACIAALPVMQRLSDSLPQGVEVWYVTHTEGSWGAKLCTPDEEVGHLNGYYRDHVKFTLPIAVWAGPKERDEDGAVLPKPSPSSKAYGINTTPTFILVDGNGIIRHLEIGLTSYGVDRIKSRIDYLVAEAAKRSGRVPPVSSSIRPISSEP